MTRKETMSRANNKVTLYGRLTRDPEGKDVAGKNGNTRVTRITLAVQRQSKDAGADFINCQAWGKNAENIEKYFKKGALILIDGNIRTGSYTKKDGTKVFTEDVVIDSWDFGGSKNDNATAPTSNATGATATQEADPFAGFQTGLPSELPFN